MASLFQPVMYGDINKYGTTSNRLYVNQLISEAYTLQNNTTIYGQVFSAGELVVKTQYICFMQEKTNWYWKQQPQQQTIIVPTYTILNPRLGVITMIYVQDIPKNVFGQKKFIQRHPVIMTDADYYYILDEI